MKHPRRSKAGSVSARACFSTLGSLGLVLAILLACAGNQDIDPSEVCKEAGYSIANRTLDCTGNAELANTRYRRLMAEFQCIAKPPPGVDPTTGEQAPGESYDQQLKCARTIFAMSCDQILVAGDNLGAYLLNGCEDIFTNSGPDGGIDVSVQSDACGAGYVPCNGGCIDLSNSTANCGHCGIDCNTVDLGPKTSERQVPVCEQSECKLGCEPGLGSCDSDPAHICTFDLLSDFTNCGRCGSHCAGTPCVDGLCR